MICPVCDHTSAIGVKICENCGSDLYAALLEQIATKKLSGKDTAQINPDDAESPTSNPVVLYIATDNKNPLAIERRANLIIGRNEDQQGTDVLVDIDLGPYGAQEMGVSRHHATLNAALQEPLLRDMGSYNGTYINGQKLTPTTDYVLKSGDEVRMGKLVMRIYYK